MNKDNERTPALDLTLLKRASEAVEDFMRTGAWGSCSQCPRDYQGRPLPSQCVSHLRHDHQLGRESLLSFVNEALGGPEACCRPCDFKSLIEEFGRSVNGLSGRNGFWDHAFIRSYDPNENLVSVAPNPSIVPEKIALIVSELGEALEAHRKNTRDDHLPEYDGLVVELADAVIRIFDLATQYKMPLVDAIMDKHAFNMSRPHKHGKRY